MSNKTLALEDQVVRLGDRLRMSVALLKQIYDDAPDHISVLVELTEVRLEADGAKLLVVTRADAHTGSRP